MSCLDRNPVQESADGCYSQSRQVCKQKAIYCHYHTTTTTINGKIECSSQLCVIDQIDLLKCKWIINYWIIQYEPPEDFDLILQRILLPLQRLLVDDLDGHQLAGALTTLGQSNLWECTAEKYWKIRLFTILSIHVCYSLCNWSWNLWFNLNLVWTDRAGLHICGVSIYSRTTNFNWTLSRINYFRIETNDDDTGNNKSPQHSLQHCLSHSDTVGHHTVCPVSSYAKRYSVEGTF